MIQNPYAKPMQNLPVKQFTIQSPTGGRPLAQSKSGATSGINKQFQNPGFKKSQVLTGTTPNSANTTFGKSKTERYKGPKPDWDARLLYLKKSKDPGSRELYKLLKTNSAHHRKDDSEVDHDNVQ